ncbi:MAG: cyclic pyranopterin monophosphate synthase MoaC [Desulfatiglans sp.]|jgi:cyclic pyranopterin phosphate synthase|nr:cyclic pyranopterin monophosphate synthase MoaC [Desulfatiglans sp.]
MGMVDITEKPVIKRTAEASGRLYLSNKTIETIKAGKVKKGDPLLIAEVAGMNAAKQTHLLIPHCHQIALDMVNVEYKVSDTYIDASCTVIAKARTGVEMEALIGVSVALNTIWDTVKYIEKDKDGQYPGTKITDIHVVYKKKE